MSKTGYYLNFLLGLLIIPRCRYILCLDIPLPLFTVFFLENEEKFIVVIFNFDLYDFGGI